MKRVIPITVVCLLVAAAAFAQRGPGGPPPPRQDPAALAAYLGLTDSQKAAAEAIENDFRATADPIHEQMHTLQMQIEAARKAADTKFAALLTPEQKTKFEAFVAAVEALRQRGPGGGGAHR